MHTIKSVLNGNSQKDRKFVFKTNYRLLQVKSIAECSKGSILQYFRPSVSYHLSLRSLFCLFWVAVLHRFYGRFIIDYGSSLFIKLSNTPRTCLPRLYALVFLVVLYLWHLAGFIQGSLSKIQGVFQGLLKTVLQFSRSKFRKILIEVLKFFF